MPRKAREISRTGIYHVMLRGINRQQIFYEEEDYRVFRNLLSHYKAICGYSIYAYCIMGNHIHILIGVGEVSLAVVIKRIGGAFVFWYNAKYERTGHLFQDRYKSEVVENEQYFLTVLRYILQNPVKANLCRMPQEYPYSSAREYLLGEFGITSVDYAFKMMGIECLRTFLGEETNEQCLDVLNESIKKCTDKRAQEIIMKEFKTLSPYVGKEKSLERQKINGSIRRVLQEGVSARQLNRLTGISRKIIEKASK